MNLIVSWEARTARVVEGSYDEMVEMVEWDERFDVFRCEADELDGVLRDNGLVLEPKENGVTHGKP